MRIGSSLLMAAVGAILRFAVEPTARVAGTFVNWDIVGDILIVAGAVGVSASIVWAVAASGRNRTVDALPADTMPREG
jgi:hypothetical protein